MSHIVIDAREWGTSTGRYVSNLVTQLDLIDIDNDYTILLKTHELNSWQPTNPRFKKVVCNHKEFTFDEQIGLKKQLESLKPDLVHYSMVQQPVLYKGKSITSMNDLTTMRFKNPSKNVLVFTLKQAVYGWVNKRVARKTNAILTFTNFVKKDIIKFTGADPKKITVTFLAGDSIEAEPQTVEGLVNQKFIMYVGRPMPHKNLWRLIEAFQVLKRDQPNLKLVLAGKKDANYESIESKVNSENIKGVFFTDFITDGQLRWLYENCQAYVFPSLSEGFGLPGLEAMAHGAPVVSSNATCLPEVYGEAAHYFDPLNVSAMANSINEVISNKELSKKLIEAGKIKFKEYSWQKTAEQTLEVYKRVLG